MVDNTQSTHKSEKLPGFLTYSVLILTAVAAVFAVLPFIIPRAPLNDYMFDGRILNDLLSSRGQTCCRLFDLNSDGKDELLFYEESEGGEARLGFLKQGSDTVVSLWTQKTAADPANRPGIYEENGEYYFVLPVDHDSIMLVNVPSLYNGDYKNNAKPDPYRYDAEILSHFNLVLTFPPIGNENNNGFLYLLPTCEASQNVSTNLT